MVEYVTRAIDQLIDQLIDLLGEFHLAAPFVHVPQVRKHLLWEAIVAHSTNTSLPATTDEVPPSLTKEPWSRLGIDIEHDFEPLHMVPRDNRDQIEPEVEVRRLVFYEITRPAIEHALAHPRDIDEALVGAHETRRLVGRL